MIKYIIEKEIRDYIGTTKSAVTFSICSLLIILSFYAGAKNYNVAQLQYQAAKEENLRQLSGLTDWLQVRQYRIFLPPQPLSVLISGVSNDIGRTVEVRGRGELSPENTRYGEDPIFAIFRFLDLDFVFQIILTLFAILFAYDAINGEKERGTLRLTFSYSVPRDKYLIGKISGSFLALIVPLLIPILLGCLLLPALGVNLSGEEWLRLSLIILSGILLTGAFLTLSVFVSSLTQKSSSSFLLLLVIWIFSVMVIPRVSVIMAGSAIDIPQIDEINFQKAKLSTQLWNEDRKAISSFKPESTSNMQDMMSEFNRFMQEKADNRDKKLRELSERLNEDRSNKLSVMENIALSIGRISPPASFSIAANSLAGTSIALEEQFKRTAEEYQETYARFMKQKTGMLTGGMIMFRQNSDEGKKPDPINPREIPVYNFRPVSLKESLASSVLDIGILLAFNLIFFAGAFFSFRKFDVR